MPRLLASMAAPLACAVLLLASNISASQQRPAEDSAAAAAGPDFRLGDLVEFRLMAEDTLLLVKMGDLPAAKKQIKVLGSAWDNAEEQLRPRSPANWTAIDKAMDRAIETLHAVTPYKAASAAAMNKLIATLDASEPK